VIVAKAYKLILFDFVQNFMIVFLRSQGKKLLRRIGNVRVIEFEGRGQRVKAIHSYPQSLDLPEENPFRAAREKGSFEKGRLRGACQKECDRSQAGGLRDGEAIDSH
jgi:hypothetical protein